MKVREQAQQRVENKAKYLDANPGSGGLDEFISWVSHYYPENEPKIYIEKELFTSPAFRSLSRIGILVYLDFLGKRFMGKVQRGKKRYGR